MGNFSTRLTLLGIVLLDFLYMVPANGRFVKAILLDSVFTTEPSFVIFLRLMLVNFFNMIPAHGRLKRQDKFRLGFNF